MKKYTLLIALVVSTYASYAQPDDFLFLMEDWYLISLEIDNEIYPIPMNSEITSGTIHFVDASPYTFSARVCGELSGEISYPTSNTFSFPTPLSPSGNACAQQVNQDFEGVFFNFFNSDLEFSYQISIVDPGPPNYYIAVTDANGNEAIFAEEPIILDVNDTAKNTFIVFPNPVSETLFITSNLKNEYNLKILNMQGAVLEERHGAQISMERYSKGVYFLEITTTEGIIETRKILKQ